MWKTKVRTEQDQALVNDFYTEGVYLNKRGENITQNEAARRLGITPQSLGAWAARPGAPCDLEKGKRTYRWPDFPRWREQELGRQIRADATPEDSEEAKRRLTTAQARKAEMEVAVMEGQLVAVDDVARETGELLDGLRSNLLAFTSKHSHELVGCKTIAEVTARLDPAIHDLMAVLAGEGEG